MAYHIDSIQTWEAFSYQGQTYSLKHLDAHDLLLVGKESSYKFVVTYGLHCFAKNQSGHSIPVAYPDGRESRSICLERYEASKQLRRLIEKIDESIIYQVSGEKFFTVERLNSATGKVEPYKICLVFFKENRLMRIHVTSAFFVRDGEGSEGQPVQKKPFSVFKIARDVDKKPRNSPFPKEARNRY